MNLQSTKIPLAPLCIICEKYRLVQSIGKGSFGEVFLAYDTITREKVAIKVEETKNSFSQLTFESKVYRYLSDGINIPPAKLFNIDSARKALVMTLMGPSLEDLHRKCSRRFTLKTVCLLADQMLNLLEYIHIRSIIHRDIKPDNFLVGLTETSRVYIVDFGLAKQFAVSRVVPHVKYNNKKCMIGTARYASINAHLGIEQSRRDDLESLGYVLLYFYLGNLPWQGITCENKNRKYDRICERKLMIPVDSLCRHAPPRFREYIEYTRRLRFDQKPDYYYLRNLFRQIMAENGIRSNDNFDWSYSDTCRSLFTKYDNGNTDGGVPKNFLAKLHATGKKFQDLTEEEKNILYEKPIRIVDDTKHAQNNKNSDCFKIMHIPKFDEDTNDVPLSNMINNVNNIQKTDDIFNVNTNQNNVVKLANDVQPRYNLRSYKKDESVTLTQPNVGRKESFQSAPYAKNQT